MAELFVLGLCALGLAVWPIWAVQGKFYRGVYGAVTVICALLAFVMFTFIGPVRSTASTEEAIGQMFFNDYGPFVIFVAMASGIGGLLGALLYRPTRKPLN